MGYDLHISRTQEWYESELDQIELEQFRAVVGPRPGWTVRFPPSWRPGEPVGFDFRDPVLPEASFSGFWDEGRITVSKPSEAALSELVPVADALGAMVVGDYCERYFSDGSRVEF